MKKHSHWFALVLTIAAAPALPQPPSTPQDQEPAWPQHFDLQGPKVQPFGFAVTQPGPLVVEVQSQGSPVSVSVLGPQSQPLQQSGSGRLRLNYLVTPQDVQRGVFWQVMVQLAPGAPSSGGLRAGGDVNVQHPPVDTGRVRQSQQASAARSHPPTEQDRAQIAARVTAQLDAAFNAQRAEVEQRRAQRRAAAAGQLQPALDAMQRQQAMEARAPEAQGAPPGKLQSRSLPQMSISRLSPPNPVISAINVTHNGDPISLPANSPPYGQPGDGVMINGSGFGSNGIVHFVVGPAPSQDVALTNAVWTSTGIFAPVPAISGVPAYGGVLYIVRSDGVKSNPLAFQFEPIMEQRQIRIMTTDVFLQPFSGVGLYITGGGNPPGNFVHRLNPYYFWNPSGNDTYFQNTRLKNGWTVSGPPSVFLPDPNGLNGGAVVVDSHVGTDSPYMNVFFWVQLAWTGGIMIYSFYIPIQGPSGLPDGLVCAVLPSDGSPCPST